MSFMDYGSQDFLAGGERGAGYYTELQSGITPTQMQVFDLPGRSHLSFTEYYKGNEVGNMPGMQFNRHFRDVPKPVPYHVCGLKHV